MNNITREKRTYDDVFQLRPMKNCLERGPLQQFIQKRRKLNENEYMDNSDKNFHKKLRYQKFVKLHSTCAQSNFKRQFCETSQSKVPQTLQSKILQYSPESHSNFNQIMTNNDNEISRSKIDKASEIMHDRLCMVNNQYRTPTTNINIPNNIRNIRVIPVNPANIVRDLSDHLDAPGNDEQEFSNLNIIPSLISERHRKAVFVENLVDIACLIIEVIWASFAVSPSAKIISLRVFIQETLRRSRTSYSTFQTALFYLFRIKNKIASISQCNKFPLIPTSEYHSGCSGQNNDPATCGRRMFLASLIVASKYLQDRNYSNRAWSKISGLSVHEINANELCFLKLIDYNLFISEDVFKRWSSFLLTHIQAISGPDISSPDAFRKAENQRDVSMLCETLRSMDSMTIECTNSNSEIYPITPAESTLGSPCNQQLCTSRSPISTLPNSIIEKMENASINSHEAEWKTKRCIHCRQSVSTPHFCKSFEYFSQSSTKHFGIDHLLDKQRASSSSISTFGNTRFLANDCNETKFENCQNTQKRFLVRALA
ncbi:4298_t:CDS:2 [Dentiscutata erythropus]|uniref:4298_t:CDS:1 n=1 Tax=Dentiscutata erythropus TaxID=1348616 RepID=A0A9N8WL78_9GLOM|nr:4298_t:CDS:2 [Dentiscutata erythropus]